MNNPSILFCTFKIFLQISVPLSELLLFCWNLNVAYLSLTDHDIYISDIYKQIDKKKKVI